MQIGPSQQYQREHQRFSARLQVDGTDYGLTKNVLCKEWTVDPAGQYYNKNEASESINKVLSDFPGSELGTCASQGFNQPYGEPQINHVTKVELHYYTARTQAAQYSEVLAAKEDRR